MTLTVYAKRYPDRIMENDLCLIAWRIFSQDIEIEKELMDPNVVNIITSIES